MSAFDAAAAAFAHVVVHDRDALGDVALEVGASAASQGLPLIAALDAIAERTPPGHEPPYVAVRAAAQAWTGSVTQTLADADCHDPLTALTSLQHLRTRLGDLYRQAEHRQGAVPVDVSHVLVVVELGTVSPHGLEAALSALETSHGLNVTFPAHETVTHLAPGRFAALVETAEADPLAFVLLNRVLAETLTDQPEPRIWIERLPRKVDSLTWLLSRLSD